MSIRNFDALFEPHAIALVGASNQPRSVGAVLARNLFGAGFTGPIMAVNPHEQAICSTLNYRSIADLPITPDLGVIATPPHAVPAAIAELGARGCRAAIVVTAGFGENERAEGRDLQQKMLDASRPHLLRIVGPNCLGVISPRRAVNASFAQLMPAAGSLAFITQSGAIATAVLDWAAPRGIGFSHVVSVGDMSDVDFGDLLDYHALDRRTRAILLYAESITHARKFLSAGRIAARTKPVLVIKAGRSEAGAKAAMSHTGAIAGPDAIYDAVFRRAGMLRVRELRELFEAVSTLSSTLRPRGNRLAILTNGGGVGVLATDALAERGGQLAKLSPETLARLDALLPEAWSRGNPVDILGDATGERYRDALAALLSDPGKDAVLVLNCPTAVADSTDAADAVITALEHQVNPPVLTCWLGEQSAAPARGRFTKHRLPAYEMPDEAVRAFMHLVEYQKNQSLLMETPASPSEDLQPDRATAARIIAEALGRGRSILTGPEAKALLHAYGVPVLGARIATDPTDAARHAGAIGFPVALKILSSDISHKTDVGGVRLDLPSEAAVGDAARAMLEAIRIKVPHARIEGFTVEAMARRPSGHELLVGIAEDPVFGPILLFGQGGTGAEVVADRSVGLPPLNLALAGEMITRTRVSKLLDGYRDRPAANREAIATTLVKLSQIVTDFDEVVELDINPLIADESGVLAIDARVVIRPGRGDPINRLAIRPYPAELEHEVVLPGGERLQLRPIRPEDEHRLAAMLMRSSPEDIRLRFLAPLRTIDHVLTARLTQIDYDRELALIATELPDDAIAGIACIVADPDNEEAEFAVMVRSDLKGRGLGYHLTTEILAHAQSRGLKRVFGHVLMENATMLTLARELGFEIRNDPDEPGLARVTMTLSAPPVESTH